MLDEKMPNGWKLYYRWTIGKESYPINENLGDYDHNMDEK
jgi:hypothetical protein